MSRTPAKTTQADIARARRVAEQASPKWVVEITPDGTIRLIPPEGSQPVPVASKKDWRL